MKHKKLTIFISLLLVLLLIMPLTAYGVSQSDIEKVQKSARSSLKGSATASRRSNSSRKNRRA